MEDKYLYETNWWGLGKTKCLGKFLYKKGNYLYFERDGIVYSKYDLNESGSDKLCFFPFILALIFFATVLVKELFF